MNAPGIRSPKLNQHSPLNIRGRPTQIYVTMSDAARDGGPNGVAAIASASTKLEPGLLVARYTSGDDAGKWAHFDTDASDGTQNEYNVGVLLDYVDVTNGEDMGHVAVGGQGLFDSEQFRYALAADKTAIDFEHLTISFV